MPGVPKHRRLGEGEPRQPLEEHPQGYLHLQPGQRGAHAGVDAGPETHVRVRTAARDEGVGLRKLRRIAVCRPQQEAHHVPRAEPLAGDVEILERVAGEHVERGVVSQHLLNVPGRVGRDRSGRVGHPLENRLHAVAQRVHRGLVPGVEQQNPHRHHLVVGQAAARAVGGRRQLRQKVFSRIAAAGGDKLPHQRRELHGRGHRAVFRRPVAAGLVDRHHVVRPGEQPRPKFDGHAEEVGDHADRKRRRVGLDEVHPPAACEAVDE